MTEYREDDQRTDPDGHHPLRRTTGAPNMAFKQRAHRQPASRVPERLRRHSVVSRLRRHETTTSNTALSSMPGPGPASA